MDGSDGLTEAVAQACGLESGETAREVLLAVLREIGATVYPPHRTAVARSLDADAREALVALEYDKSVDLDAVIAKVAAREHVAEGFGREHLVSVLGALKHHVPDEAWSVFEAELPADVRAIVPAAPTSVPPEPPSRAGAQHSVGERRAQSDSVAASGDPHGSTKLSEAHGFTQEREGESLATGNPDASSLASGKPGFERPLSDAKPEE
jgi:uncharacterized protein (DUF2267 family)